ncbi:hypothetical protein V8C86DRAFT_3129709 [Haematococcus lacustris]
MLPKRAPIVTPDAIAAAQPLLDTRTPEGLQNQTLLYIGVNGQFRINELHALQRSHFVVVQDAHDPDKRDMFKINALACKNWQGGLQDVGRPPPCKYIVPNPNYTATGDAYEDAKDESFTDEYRLSMGGWKSRDAMAAYAHHGAAKRAKASAMMAAISSDEQHVPADVSLSASNAAGWYPDAGELLQMNLLPKKE